MLDVVQADTAASANTLGAETANPDTVSAPTGTTAATEITDNPAAASSPATTSIETTTTTAPSSSSQHQAAVSVDETTGARGASSDESQPQLATEQQQQQQASSGRPKTPALVFVGAGVAGGVVVLVAVGFLVYRHRKRNATVAPALPGAADSRSATATPVVPV